MVESRINLGLKMLDPQNKKALLATTNEKQNLGIISMKTSSPLVKRQLIVTSETIMQTEPSNT